MDKENLIYVYNGILFNYTKVNTAICYNMGEPWNTKLSERSPSQQATYCHILSIFMET